MRPSFFFSSQVLPHIFSINHFLASLHYSPVSPFFSLSSSFPTFENSFIQQALLSVYCTLNTKHSAGCGTWTWSQYSFYLCIQASQFSRSVMSDSLRPQGQHHSMLLSPSLSPSLLRFISIESWWCHLTISSSATPFFCPQSLPAPGSFPVRQLFTSGSQNIGASASVVPVNIQGCSPLGLTGMISLLSRGLSGVL